MLGLGLYISAAASLISAIVERGLKIFLPFKTSQQLGEELVVNGDFSDGTTNWSSSTASSASISVNASNELVIISGDGENGGAYTAISLIQGRDYILSIDIISSNILGRIEIGTASSVGSGSPSDIFNASGSGVPVGTNVYNFTATSTQASRGFIYIGGRDDIDSLVIDNVSLKEVGQFSLDETTNNNNAKLFTGNALDFDGLGDYVQVPNSNSINLGTSDFTFAFWINKVASGSGTQRVIDKRSVKGYTVYLDTNNVLILELNDGSGNVGFTLGTITNDVYQRIIVSADRSGNATCYINNVAQTPVDISSKQSSLDDSTDLFIGADAPSSGGLYFMGKLSDFQIWNAAWSATDVANDYADPNQLVSSVSVSNLKGWWALTEGSGSFAFDNATAPGSELIVNGDFEIADASGDDTGATDWVYTGGGSWSISGDGFATNDGTNTSVAYLNQTPGGVTPGKTYKVTFEVDSISAGEVRVFVGGVETLSPRTTAEVFTEYITAGSTAFWLRAGGGFIGSITNVSVKEISAGTINGATYVDSQSSILQLGMINWSNGSNVFLPPSPTNSSQDILGNAVRNRLNSLNLTGTGYGEVAEVTGLDVTDFTIEAWVRFDYTNSGSTTNVIYVNGGVSTDVDTFALTTDENNKVKFIVGNTNVLSTTVFSNNNWVHIAGTRESGALKLYINGNKTPEATGTSGAAVNNALDLLIGKDTQANRFYKERIDDVRLYGVALSADEVEQNYNAGASAHTN